MYISLLVFPILSVFGKGMFVLISMCCNCICKKRSAGYDDEKKDSDSEDYKKDEKDEKAEDSDEKADDEKGYEEGGYFDKVVDVADDVYQKA